MHIAWKHRSSVSYLLELRLWVNCAARNRGAPSGTARMRSRAVDDAPLLCNGFFATALHPPPTHTRLPLKHRPDLAPCQCPSNGGGGGLEGAAAVRG